MLIPSDIVDKLEEYGTSTWSGVAWRFVLGKKDPLKPSLRGGRWGTREGFAILYTSLEKDTAIAEGEHLVSLFSIPPDTSWNIYQLEIELAAVVDISASERMTELGVDLSEYQSSWGMCPQIGAAANFLGYQGLIAPSARSNDNNLMIFSENLEDKGIKIDVTFHQELRRDQR